MNGMAMIAAERNRQRDVEGWTPEHDAQHAFGELALAAACYAAPIKIYCREFGTEERFIDPWPWGLKWDKRNKHPRLRQLVIAGALIAAEIDRILADDRQ